MPKGRLDAEKPCTVSLSTPTTNTESVTVAITWTATPPDGALLLAAAGQTQTYRQTSTVAKKAMTLRISVPPGQEARVEVTSNGQSITDQSLSGQGGARVWAYVTR